MSLSHRLATAMAAALLLTAGLTGCSMLEDDSASSSGGDSAAEPGVDNDGEPVTKGTFNSPIASGAKVDIAIMGIKVKGKLSTLTTRITPHVPPGGDQSPSLYDLNGDEGPGTSLIDPVNLKRYVVVEDSSGDKMRTDYITTHIANDQPSTFWVTFAAPPENVETVDVQIGSWPTFRNIPVER